MKNRFGASLIALSIAAAPAMAEIDAATLLGEWEALALQEGGMQIDAASRVESDTSVQMRDVTISVEDFGDLITLSLPAVDMVETPEGAVVVTLTGPAELKVVNMSDPQEDNASVTVILDGVRLTISDTDGISYQLTSTMIGLQDGQITEDGSQLTASLNITLANFAALFADTGPNGPEQSYDVAVSSDAVQGVITAAFPDDGVPLFDLRFEMSEMRTSFDGSGPANWLLEGPGGGDVLDLLSNGLFADLTVAFAYEEISRNGRYATNVVASGGADLFEFNFGANNLPDLEPVFEGRASYPDGVGLDMSYTLAGLNMDFDFSERREFNEGEPYETSGRFTIEDSTSSLSAVLGDSGVLEFEASVATSFDGVSASSDVYSGTTYLTEFDGRANGLSYNIALQIPVRDLVQNPMMMMQGIPEQLSYQIAYQLADVAFSYNDGWKDETGAWEYRSEMDAEASGFDAAAELSSEGVLARFALGGIDWAFEEDGEMYGASVTDVAYNLVLPLNIGGELERYALELGFADLTMSDTFWDEFDRQRALVREPISFSFLAEGMSRVQPNWFAVVSMGAGSPFDVASLVFQLDTAGFGATLRGSGDFDPSASMSTGAPPIGTAEFVGTGLEELIEGIASMDLLSDSEMQELRFFFGAFTEAQPDGTRVMNVEINEQQHLIVNGQRLQ